jgi:beta-glucanase (GH16 family)
MKKISLILVACIAILSCKKNETKPTATSTETAEYNPGTGWNLAWSDEFDGTTLNTSNWYVTDAKSNVNSELEYYSPQNVSVADGNLVLTAKRESYGGASFTSGKVDSYNKYTFKYGKVVAKMKLPEGLGMWPAFWMLGVSSTPWPGCGEIDIMEMAGGGTNGDNTISSTCHWSDASNVHQYYGQPYTYKTKLSAAYHYYEVEWTATKIIARFDGVQMNETDITAAAVTELRDNNYYIIFNLAVGGNFFYPVISNPSQVTATLPQNMYVDWVRVYKN